MSCVGYVGQNIFYVGNSFMWIMIYMRAALVKYIFAWVKNFYVGFYVGQKLLLKSILGAVLKKISIGAFTIIS